MATGAVLGLAPVVHADGLVEVLALVRARQGPGGLRPVLGPFRPEATFPRACPVAQANAASPGVGTDAETPATAATPGLPAQVAGPTPATAEAAGLVLGAVAPVGTAVGLARAVLAQARRVVVLVVVPSPRPGLRPTGSPLARRVGVARVPVVARRVEAGEAVATLVVVVVLPAAAVPVVAGVMDATGAVAQTAVRLGLPALVPRPLAVLATVEVAGLVPVDGGPGVVHVLPEVETVVVEADATEAAPPALRLALAVPFHGVGATPVGVGAAGRAYDNILVAPHFNVRPTLSWRFVGGHGLVPCPPNN